jgi:hypothetical protein
MKKAVSGPIVTTGLVMNLDAGNSASYPGSGTTWTDLSGNSRTGTLINGVGYSSANNGYLTFNGSNQHVAVSNIISFLSAKTNFSFDIWFKLNNPTLNNSIFSFGVGGNFTNDILIAVYGSVILAQVNNGVDGSAYTSFSSTAWTNIQVVFDGTLTGNSNRLKMYINGVLQTLTISYTVPSISATSTGTSSIGAYTSNYNGNRLNGNIAVTRGYNTSLTSTEVTQNFNAIRSRYGL